MSLKQTTAKKHKSQCHDIDDWYNISYEVKNCVQTPFFSAGTNLIMKVHSNCYTKAHLGMVLSRGLWRLDEAPRTLLFICLTACFVFWPLECASRLLNKLSVTVGRQGSASRLLKKLSMTVGCQGSGRITKTSSSSYHCHLYLRLSRVLAPLPTSFSRGGSEDRFSTIVALVVSVNVMNKPTDTVSIT